MSQLKALKSYSWVYLLAFTIRAIIILYTSYIDSKLVVKYTDIDYGVYNDAAMHVSEGLSPYLRSTYRYSPLLAFFMLPNIWYPEFGKMLFALLDIVAAILLSLILLQWGVFNKTSNPVLRSVGWSCLWLFNPLAINMSTRGSADVMTIVLVFFIIYLLLQKRNTLAALVYGFTVHFRIYPIVYAPALFLYVGYQARKAKSSNQKPSSSKPFIQSLFSYITTVIFDYDSILFGIIAGLTFIGLIAMLYPFYGYEFVYETYLYHFIRKDIRHNFSIYFYFLYLTSSPQPSSHLPSFLSTSLQTVFSIIPSNVLSFLHLDDPTIQSSLVDKVDHLDIPWHTLSTDKYEMILQVLPPLIAFVPQFTSLLVVAFKLYKDLPACLLLQTLIFVAFNKVCTAQYFLWWVSLLPLVLPITLRKSKPSPEISISRSLKTIAITGLWFLGEVGWLLTGLYREVYGRQVYLIMWLASIVFFCINIFILLVIVKYHYWSEFELSTTPIVTELEDKKKD